MTKFYKQPPYITAFRKKRKNTSVQEFIYIGSEHSHDIKHPQFGIVQRYWERWLENKDKDNCVALHEGGAFDPSEGLENATYENAERGFLAWKAKQEDMQFDSPEPDYKQEMRHLLQEFSKEQIFHYYFIRNVVQWHRIDPRPDFREYFEFVSRMPKRYGVDDYDLTIERLKEIHKEITGYEFDPEDKDYAYKLSNPFLDLNITNKVSRKCSNFRDQHIIKEIKHYWDEGKSIFAVYGHSHVEEQEEHLKEILL